jgi:hypothetical protein
MGAMLKRETSMMKKSDADYRERESDREECKMGFNGRNLQMIKKEHPAIRKQRRNEVLQKLASDEFICAAENDRAQSKHDCQEPNVSIATPDRFVEQAVIHPADTPERSTVMIDEHNHCHGKTGHGIPACRTAPESEIAREARKQLEAVVKESDATFAASSSIHQNCAQARLYSQESMDRNLKVGFIPTGFIIYN